MKRVNMICGVFSRITFKLKDVRKMFGRHNRPIWVMEKRIINELDEIRKAQTNHIGEKCKVSDHTHKGSTYGVTLVTTLVSHTHVGA